MLSLSIVEVDVSRILYLVFIVNVRDNGEFFIEDWGQSISCWCSPEVVEKAKTFQSFVMEIMASRTQVQ